MDMLAKNPPVWNRLSNDARNVLENLFRQMSKQGQPKAVPAAPPPAPFSKRASAPQPIYGDPNKPLPIMPASPPADPQCDQHPRDRSSSPESKPSGSTPRSRSRGKHHRGKPHPVSLTPSLTYTYQMQRVTILMHQCLQGNDLDLTMVNQDVVVVGTGATDHLLDQTIVMNLVMMVM